MSVRSLLHEGLAVVSVLFSVTLPRAGGESAVCLHLDAPRGTGKAGVTRRVP